MLIFTMLFEGIWVCYEEVGGFAYGNFL